MKGIEARMKFCLCIYQLFRCHTDGDITNILWPVLALQQLWMR